MLPFIKKKYAGGSSGLIVKHRTPDEKPEENQEPMDSSAAIESCARALIQAVQANDAKGVADAMYDAFCVMEAMPHEEADHSEPHSYEAQNIKAAR